jgi:arylformamidase
MSGGWSAFGVALAAHPVSGLFADMDRDLKIWDISQPLRPSLPVWPGDTAFESRRRWSIGADGPVNVSAFTASTHSGAHADAPLHYDAEGAAIEAVALEPYLGCCLLVDARGRAPLIDRAFVEAAVPAGTRRVLFRTYERFPHAGWDEGFTAIDAGAIEALAARGVILIGLDSPSLDPQESKTLDAHHAVRRADMRVLEGLVLDAPPPGAYELIALPLPLEGLDASPVRAVLRALPR